MKKFMDLLEEGQEVDVDEYISDWHSSHSTESLSEFLGMTEEEYTYWINNTYKISELIRIREEKRWLYSPKNIEKDLSNSVESIKLDACTLNNPNNEYLSKELNEKQTIDKSKETFIDHIFNTDEGKKIAEKILKISNNKDINYIKAELIKIKLSVQNIEKTLDKLDEDN
jgi:hypothetical protein